MKKFFIALFKFYQTALSPAAGALGAQCRFYPTCSHYAISAFENHGLPKALWLTIKRLAKCGPWNEGGVDELKGDLK
jgi:putative membrane protein insertion efficiency factor